MKKLVLLFVVAVMSMTFTSYAGEAQASRSKKQATTSTSVTPKQAAQRFFNALINCDGDNLWKYGYFESQTKDQAVLSCLYFAKNIGDAKYKVTKVAVNGNRGTAYVKNIRDGRRYTWKMVKINGQWKVDMVH